MFNTMFAHMCVCVCGWEVGVWVVGDSKRERESESRETDCQSMRDKAEVGKLSVELRIGFTPRIFE